MSAELARRLLDNGVIPPEEVHAALLDVVTLGIPFVQALVSRSASAGEQLERELSRIRVPVAVRVRVAAELARELPAGMCERLLAVPVGRSPRGEVEVACVDPLDPAVGQEFAHRFKGAVSISRASLSQLLIAIERWLDERDAQAPLSSRTPAFGTRAVRRPSSPGLGFGGGALAHGAARPPVESEPPPSRGSAPPIPLVRRSLPPVTSKRPATDPGVGRPPLISVVEEDEAGEPIIGLFRSKPPPRSEDAPSLVTFEGAPPPPADPALVDAAESADDLVQRLAELCAPLARHVLVFALRTGVYEARAASPGLGGSWRGLKVAASPRAVFELAILDGHFLGRLPDDALHSDLRAVLGDAEVYVRPVMLSGRAAVSLVLAELHATLEGTRRADELTDRASAALARIAKQKKRKG